ncbi:hypothetical protein D3C76_1332470 [compost metagenome]
MPIHDVGLQANALREQAIVIAKELDQLTPGLLQTHQQVARKAQRLRVAHIAYWRSGLGHHGVDDTLNFHVAAVVAHQHFQRWIVLVDGTEQGGAEEFGVEGRDGDADEGLLIHGEDLAVCPPASP